MNFKKKLMAMSLVSSLTLSICIPTFAATNNVNVQVNGVQNIEKASLIDGKSYIKVSDIKNVLGIDCTVSGDKLNLTDEKNVGVVKIDGTEYAVIREVATAENYMIGWDETEKTVVIVDTDRINTSTFTIMEKYMKNVLETTPELSKTTGTFKGSVEVTDDKTVKVPFTGTISGVSSKTVANVDMNLKVDLSDLKKAATAEGTDVETAIEKTILEALENSDTKIIFDEEKGVYYIKSNLLDTIGIEKDAWLSIDLNELLGMSGSPVDMKSIMELATKGDIKGYIDSAIKSIPVDSISSYDQIKTAYDTIANLIGDDSFKLENGKYTSNYTVSEDGVEMTYSMILDTDGDKINGCTIKMHMNSAGTMNMDMEAVSDKNLNSTITINMSVEDMMKLYMEFKSSTKATTETPISAPAADEKVVSFESLMGSVDDLEAEVETPAEAKVETPAEAKVETPAEAKVETPAEAKVETPAEAKVETPVEAKVETPAKAA